MIDRSGGLLSSSVAVSCQRHPGSTAGCWGTSLTSHCISSAQTTTPTVPESVGVQSLNTELAALYYDKENQSRHCWKSECVGTSLVKKIAPWRAQFRSSATVGRC